MMCCALWGEGSQHDSGRLMWFIYFGAGARSSMMEPLRGMLMNIKNLALL